MPRGQRTETQGNTSAAVPVPTTTETVVCTVPVNTDGADDRVDFDGYVKLTTGTATTGVTFRIRRGSGITGTVVGDQTAEVQVGAAGTTADYSIAGSDTPGEFAGAYSLTVQQTAATANGSAVAGSLQAVY